MSWRAISSEMKGCLLTVESAISR